MTKNLPADAAPRLDLAELDERFPSSRTERVAVLIVGGGLVGLSAALFLTQHGVRPLVIERHTSTADHPRARGFQPPTVELLAPSGVADAMVQAGLSARPGDGVGVLTAVTLAGPVLRWQIETSSASSPRSPYPLVVLGQDRLEPMLLAAARRGGASVRFGHFFRAFASDAGGVAAVVEDRITGERYRIDADYLIAADGARSPIREALGIARTGHGLLGHNVSTLVELDPSHLRCEHPFAFAQLTHPEAAGVVVATDVPSRWIYATRFDPTQASAEDFTAEEWVRRFRIAAGVSDLAVTAGRTHVWEVAERVVERMADGRIFLAGDAAHQMPPTGGWGANTGIQDAANLAWKLAAVIAGHAPPRLLDTYDTERRPVAAATAHQAALLALRMAQPGRVADDQLAEDDAVVFGYRYGVEPAIPRTANLRGEPGSRAPHVQLGAGTSTLCFFGRGFVLLAGHPGWQHAAVELASTDVPLRVELADGWQDAYGVAVSGAALIRPDGFVAARWDTHVDASRGTLQAAIDRALYRPMPMASIATGEALAGQRTRAML